jgi:DNA invertase Pin-like site-specific DNA recombinase
MLNLIEADGIDTLICWHTDRLYRRPQDLERLLDLLDRGALPGTVRTVTAGDLDLSTPTGRMVARLLAAVASGEVEHGRERLLAAQRQAALEGRPTGGGTRAFGYETDRVTVCEPEATLIREATHRVLDGESPRAIAADWTARGIATVTGKRWRGETLTRVLTSGRVAGLRSYRGKIVGDGQWPAIIDPATRDLLVARLVDSARTKRGGTGRKFTLTGLARCGLCGARVKVYTRPDPARTQYSCPPPAEGGCGKVGVNVKKSEAHVASLVFDRLTRTDLGDLNPAPDGSRRAEVVAALDAVGVRIVEIGEAIGTGALSMVAGAAAERVALAEQASLEAELRRLTLGATVPDLPTGIEWEDWRALTVDVQVQIVAAMVRQITVLPAAHRGQHFTPDRLRIEWADLPVEASAVA